MLRPFDAVTTDERVPRRLDITLPRFSRVTWVASDLGSNWAARVEKIPTEQLEAAVAAVLEGRLQAGLIRVAAAEIPSLMRQALATGMQLTVLGPESPGQRIRRLLALDPCAGELWCCLSHSADKSSIEAAWVDDDVEAFAADAGIPPCCARAAAGSNRLEAEWRLMSAASSGASPALNYRLLRLGVAPLPYLSCGSGCAASLRLAAASSSAAAETLLRMPVRWSALHGIGEVVTPVLRLVFDALPTADRHDAEAGDPEAAPADAPTGVRFPFRPARGKRIEASQSFQLGIDNMAGRAATLEHGRVDRIRLDPGTELPPRPVFFDLPGPPWRAFSRWTPQFLKERLGSAPVASTLVPAGAAPQSFADYIDRVLELEPSTPHYLFGFRFEDLSPEMVDDYQVPEQLHSWHYLLDPADQPTYRILMLGGSGTGTHLHQEALNTDTFVAVMWGCKRWALCPPESDGRLLGSTVDLFDPETSRRLSRQGIAITYCDQRASDMLYVPSGWWHQVINLGPTLALSENIVSERNAEAVLEILDNPGDGVDASVVAALRRAVALGRGIARQ